MLVRGSAHDGGRVAVPPQRFLERPFARLVDIADGDVVASAAEEAERLRVAELRQQARHPQLYLLWMSDRRLAGVWRERECRDADRRVARLPSGPVAGWLGVVEEDDLAA